jgi:hypothetical protein
VDRDDRNMREGLAILQLVVMRRAPSVVGGTWSPLLQKISTCKEVAAAVADFLLTPLSKKE